MRSKSQEICVVLLVVLLPSLGHAVDETRLWLPQKYQKTYLSLVKSAEVAESIERCVSVVEGTIDVQQSKGDKPIFRILCRQENGRTYNEMVDGLTFETLTTPQAVVVELTELELEQIRLEEEAKRQAQLVALKTEYWQNCRQAAEKEAYLMESIKWLSSEQAEPDSFTVLSKPQLSPETTLTAEAKPLSSQAMSVDSKDPTEDAPKYEALYHFNFDAKSPTGERLEYTAKCQVNADEGTKITIKKR